MSAGLPDRRYAVNPDGTLTPERKYALIKIEAGDYLLPGNDGATLWRLKKGRVPWIGESGDIEYRPGWELIRWSYRLGTGREPETLDLDSDEWEFEESCDSRADAIQRACELAA